MNSGPIDISSDEDAALRFDAADDDSVDWLSNLIDSAERRFEANDDDDDDDVVVIGEVNAAPRPKNADDDDDDCVVLEGDPEKVESVEEDGSGSGSDDLVVVGEKGQDRERKKGSSCVAPNQIACRDYPHPRHLCAKYPFTSTPHEKHCNLCHCYVCDSLSPCVHWGNGTSYIGHCHATEKVDMWKVMRRNFKMGRSTSMPAIKVYSAVPQLSQVPPRLAPNSIMQTQVYRSSTIPVIPSARPNVPACTSIPLKHIPMSTLIRQCPSTTVLNSTGRFPVRSNQQRVLSSKNGIQPAPIQTSSASQHLLGNGQRSSRAHNRSNGGGLHCTSSPTMFKRVGPVRGSLANNQPTYGPMFRANVNPSLYSAVNDNSFANPSQCGRVPSSMVASTDRLSYSWQEVHNSLDQISSLPMGSDIIGSVLPPQQYSEPIMQSAYSQNVQQGSQVQNDDQSICQFANQSEIASQNSQVQTDGRSICPLGNQSQNASQNVSLEGVGASPVDFDFSGCNYSWMNNTDQNYLQPLPPVENSQVQSTAVYGPDTQSNGYPNLNCFESNFESWLLDNLPVSPLTDDIVPSHLDILSPPPPAVDPGMLYFDYDTSFNGITEV